LELDERYRAVLDATEFSVRREFANIQLEIDTLQLVQPIGQIATGILNNLWSNY
jgi:hypothetical protein